MVFSNLYSQSYGKNNQDLFYDIVEMDEAYVKGDDKEDDGLKVVEVVVVK